MFESELFGLLKSDYTRVAETLFVPTIGFVFLYLLRLPLRHLPLIAEAADYTPPTWLLPIFALGTFFVFCLALSTAGFLTIYRESPPTETFLQSYQRVRTIDVKSDPNEALKSVEISLDKYDGSSDFRIFVNGYRIFGSSQNCKLKFQCKPVGNEVARTELQLFLKKAPSNSASLFQVGTLFELPYLQNISELLVPGGNFIDIHSSRSGLEGCGLVTRLRLSYSTGVVREYRTVIASGNGLSPPRRGPMLETELFYADGVQSQDADPGTLSIEPYRTPWVRAPYRVCERIRVQLSIAGEAFRSLETARSLRN